MAYPDGWTKYIEITVDKTKLGSADQTDFPVYVNLDDLPDAFFTNCMTTGADVVVTNSDGSTKLSRELVSIDTTAKTGELYFKGTLSSSTNTVFRIYYGNSSGAETNDTTTWNSGFVGVWHLKDDPNTSTVQDSTANGYDGAKRAATEPTEVDVKIYKGQSFTAGELDRIDLGNQTNLDLSSVNKLSLECWAKGVSAWGGAYVLIHKEVQYDIRIENGVFRFYLGDGNNWTDYDLGATLSIDTLYHLGFVFDNTQATEKQKEFINGAKGETWNLDTTLGTNTAKILIGCSGVGESYASGWNGLIDEMRLSNVARADSWMTASYNNQNSSSTFYSVGAEQTVGGGGSPTGCLTLITKFWGF